MTNRPLLDRQTSILKHLTDPGAFMADAATAADTDLAGLDFARLRLLALMSHGKRMEKIETCLPRTFALIGGELRARSHAFAELYRPFSVSRYENARQFFAFLKDVWYPADGGRSPWVLDLAAFELAVNKLRTLNRDRDEGDADGTSGPAIRCSRSVEPLRCEFDIRQLLEEDPDPSALKRREVCLVIQLPQGGTTPRIFELSPAVFTLLQRCSEWRPRISAHSQFGVIVDDLIERGVMELRE